MSTSVFDDASSQGGLNGRWGFSIQIPNVANGPAPGTLFGDLISVNLETPRAWTVHLSTMRFSGLVGVPFSTSINADNQVDSYWQVQLIYGANDNSDRVIVDYPARGGTFQVHASNVRLAILRPFDAPQPLAGSVPLLSGWISDEPRATQAIVSPTYSLQPLNIPTMTSVIVPIPDHACAYRIWERPQTNMGTQVNQLDSAQTVIITADYGPSIFASQDMYQQQENRGAYRPLHAGAQMLAVSNTQALAVNRVTLQFLLDLG